jgi:hypothetical protein
MHFTLIVVVCAGVMLVCCKARREGDYGMQKDPSRFDLPDKNAAPEGGAAVSYNPPNQATSGPSVDKVISKHESSLMSLPGVKGVGVTKDRIGNNAIVVYLRDQSASKHIPKILDGVTVITEVTGEVDAQ